MQNDNKIPGSGRKGENPFSVPGNYFETFPQRLRQRLDEEKQVVSTPWEKILVVIKPQLAVAAVIAVLLISGYFGLRNFVFQQDMMLTNEEIAGYMELYQHEFSDYYFLSMLDDDLYPEEFYLDQSMYPADPDVYMDYLYNSDIDIELIITEF
jgi:hypothetical protein